MRRPDQDQLSDDTTDAGAVGDGFGATVNPADFSGGYGTDDGFYDDYDDTYDDDSPDSSSRDSDGSDGADRTGDDVEVDDRTSADSSITDDEAEEILEDILEETYGSEADEMVDELEDSTGLSAVELLEQITGLDLDGSEDGYSNDQTSDTFEADGGGALSPLDVNPFDPSGDVPEADMPSEADLDLDSDGDVDHADLHEAAHPFDFHVGD